MPRRLLLPALAIATLAGCATGHSYRGGNSDYYYGQPGVDNRNYGGYGYGGSIGYGFGQGYYLDAFGRPVYGYPYGYYSGRYPDYPYGHGPRPRPPQGPGHDGGHHDGDHDGPPTQGGYRPGNRPPWRDIGRVRDRDEDEQAMPGRLDQPEASPRMQPPPPRERPSAPVLRERSESRPASGGVRGGGSGERSRVRATRPSAED